MTTILIKKKDTAGAPAPGDLTNAAGGTEIAVNTATKRIYTKDAGGNVVELGTNASSSTIADLTVTTSTTLSYGTANQVQFLNASKLLVGSGNMTFNGTRLTVADLADSGLTSGRVTYASTGGALVDSANLTFDGNILSTTSAAIGGTLGMTVGGALNGTTINSTGVLLGGTQTLTINAGTANGVAYLNGSKVLTTGSALTFDGSNLGLGVTPSAWLSTTKALQLPTGSLFSPNNGSLALAANVYTDGTSTNRYVANNFATYHDQTNGTYRWFTAPSGTAGNAISFTQAMTLDAFGSVQLGTTNNSGSARRLIIKGSGTADGAIVLKSSSTAEGGNAGFLLQSFGTNSEAYLWNFENQPMIFGTNNTERARIDSSGNLLVNTPTFASRISVKSAVNSYANGISHQNTGTAYWTMLTSGDSNFYFGYQGADRSYINSTTGAYVAVSDQRLKKNITDINYGLNEVLALRAVSYNMNEQTDTDAKSLGFIAQETLQVIPESVSKMQGGMYGMDKVEIVPVLVKAIQEQQAIITALTARVAALESN